MDAVLKATPASSGQHMIAPVFAALAQTMRPAFAALARTLLDTAAFALHPSSLYLALATYLAWRMLLGLVFSPLRHLPGSHLSRMSSLPSLLTSLTRCTNDDMVRDCERYGNVFVMEPTKVAVCHPEDCRLVLSSYAFVKDELYANVDFMEQNIFLTRDADLNKQRRRQIGPALSMNGLRRMEPTILEAGPCQLMDSWDARIAASGGQARVCYFYDLTLMSFDIIASLGFGHQHRSLTTGDRTIAHWVEKTFGLMIVQMVLPIVKWWPLRPLADYVFGHDVDDLFAFGHRAINQRRVELARGQPKPNDILQQFIDAEDPQSNGAKMTPQQVITETVMMLLSGADTSSTAMTWTIHLLMLYPEHYNKLVGQIRNAFAKDSLLTYDMVREKVPYMEACILEALRICPVSTNLPRIVPPGGVTLRDGHHIPGGYSVAVSTAAANYNPEAWTQPHLFDPTRFLSTNPQSEHNRKNLMTLSAGVRICPGRHLVMVEMTTTLANLLNRYDFSLPVDARYTPDNVGGNGLPQIMPRTNLVAMVPKYPDRDCNVIIAKRK